MKYAVKLFIAKTQYVHESSGRAVQYWMQKEHIEIDKVLIVVDDLSLPLARFECV